MYEQVADGFWPGLLFLLEGKVEKKSKKKKKDSWFEEGKALDMNTRTADHKLNQDRK